MLSRTEMERVIQQGGAVLYRGRSIARVQDLPSEAELAKGNPAAEMAAAANIQAQMADLQRQLAQLQAGQVRILEEAAATKQQPIEPTVDEQRLEQPIEPNGRRAD